MEAKLKEAAKGLAERYGCYTDERMFLDEALSQMLADGVIEIGPNLNTGPDAEAMADEFIAICGGDAAEAERIVTRTRRFA